MIDIDLLTYDELLLNDAGLVLPHPRLHERAFVLVPLAEIVPTQMIAGRSVQQWLSESDQAGIERMP